MIEEISQFIQVGNFRLKGGGTSKYYYDLKNMISYPQTVKKLGDHIYKNYIEDMGVDRIAAIPIGSISVCSYISTRYNIPMIVIRNESKGYGTAKFIEGEYKATDSVLIIDDVLTTGGSVQTAIKRLEDCVNELYVVVVIDRQEHIPSFPYDSVFTKTDITKHRLNRIISNKGTRLCFSADDPDPFRNLEILEKIAPYIAVVKIHYDIWDDVDGDLKKLLVELSAEHNFLIMQDSKYVDISSIVERQHRSYRSWVDLVTVHGSVSQEVIKKLPGCIIVANMSNNNWDMTQRAIDLATNNPQNVVGFVTQKRIELDGFLNMTPGVSRGQSSAEDQPYRSADQVDTDIMIVGRGIYQAENPVEAAKYFASQRNVLI